MPRGYTTVTFTGGIMDGEIIDNVSLRNLPNKVNFQHEIYFATARDGGMNLMKGKLNKHWYSYTIDIYEKAPNDKYKKGTIFEFLETREVERCSAITKKGTQCLHSAMHNKSYCCATHNNKESDNDKVVSNLC